MNKLLVLVFLFISANAYCNEIIIRNNCVHLHEILGDEYPPVELSCNIRPGEKKNISSTLLINYFKRNGLPPPSLKNSYTVIREGFPIENEKIASQIESLYKQNYPEKDVKVESVRISTNAYSSAPENYQIIVDISKFGSVPGIIEYDNFKLSFFYTVKIYGNTYKALENIHPGDNLEGTVVYERVDITNSTNYISSDINEKIAAKFIAKGTTVTESNVIQKPDIQKGEKVKVIYKNGNMSMSMEGIADSNGNIGKKFSIKNPSSGTVINAIYQGNGIAIIE